MAGLWPASMEGNGENAMILQTSCRKLRDYSKSQCKSSFRVRLAVVFMRIMRCCEVGCGNCTDTLMLCRGPSWSTCRWDLRIWMIWFHSYWTEFMIWKQLVESVCDISRFLVLQCVWSGEVTSPTAGDMPQPSVRHGASWRKKSEQQIKSNQAIKSRRIGLRLVIVQSCRKGWGNMRKLQNLIQKVQFECVGTLPNSPILALFFFSQAFNLTWQLDASAQTSARISRMRPGVRFFMPILTSSNEKSISTRTITEIYWKNMKQTATH